MKARHFKERIISYESHSRDGASYQADKINKLPVLSVPHVSSILHVCLEQECEVFRAEACQNSEQNLVWQFYVAWNCG